MAVTSVNDTNTSIELLASSRVRNGVSIWNDSTATLYVLSGKGTASSTNFSFKLSADDYWESPDAQYARGDFTGVWSADGSGAARITTW